MFTEARLLHGSLRSNGSIVRRPLLKLSHLAFFNFPIVHSRQVRPVAGGDDLLRRPRSRGSRAAGGTRPCALNRRRRPPPPPSGSGPGCGVAFLRPGRRPAQRWPSAGARFADAGGRGDRPDGQLLSEEVAPIDCRRSTTTSIAPSIGRCCGCGRSVRTGRKSRNPSERVPIVRR
jgi:hypothetical protein